MMTLDDCILRFWNPDKIKDCDFFNVGGFEYPGFLEKFTP